MPHYIDSIRPVLFAALFLHFDEDVAVLPLVVFGMPQSTTQPLLLRGVLKITALPVCKLGFPAYLTEPPKGPQHESSRKVV